MLTFYQLRKSHQPLHFNELLFVAQCLFGRPIFASLLKNISCDVTVCLTVHFGTQILQAIRVFGFGLTRVDPGKISTNYFISLNRTLVDFVRATKAK
jgi:hypothetical protein